MKIKYSWLCDYLKNPTTPQETVDQLNRIGLKVESVSKTGASFTGVVVGKIEKIDVHPNADKLHLVDINDGTTVQRVVCGAKNIAVGQIVPLAKLGAKLPGGELKKAKIRGIESEGMLCSCSELGVDGDPSGIMILPPDTPLGKDVLSLFPKSDVVFEVEMLPNQGYCLSHFAVARELSIFYGLELKEPDNLIHADSSENTVKVKIHDVKLCSRYTAIVMKNVRGAKTPDWMAERLRSIDVNPKGNILIDGSNYVMFEYGQPLHCFDLAKLSGRQINVRSAVHGEIFKALDKSEHKLNADNLVIADAEKPSALAGIMGGEQSAVADDTDEIVIESACFLPSSIRKTSKGLNVKSDSSYRFERGTDPEATLKAAKRFAKLICDAEPSAKIVQVTDEYPVEYQAKPIDIKSEKINALLGTGIADEIIYSCLKAFQPNLADGSGEWGFIPPSYRHDMTAVCDVAEEVARYVGYNSIPTVSNMPMIPSTVTPVCAVSSELRASLAAIGLNEVYNHEFLSAKEVKVCGISAEESLEVKNPLSSDLQYLRPSLTAGLLKTLRYNINRGRDSVNVFELGTVYYIGDKKNEEIHCGGLMYGRFCDSSWKNSFDNADFYSVKGVLTSLFAGKSGLRFERPQNNPSYYKSGYCLEIKIGANSLGFMGQLSANVCSEMNIKDNKVFYFEFSVPVLATTWKNEFWQKVNKVKPVSPFPASWRDLSFVIDEHHEWLALERAFQGIKNLSSVKLIDVFKGKNIPEGQRSMTVRFTFTSMEKTFTDAEVSERIKEAQEKLNRKFNAKLRE